MCFLPACSCTNLTIVSNTQSLNSQHRSLKRSEFISPPPCMYRQPQYIFSSHGRSCVFSNALAICGTLTSFINRTVYKALRACSTSLGKGKKGSLKRCFGWGSIGVLWIKVSLEPFFFEEKKWAALETVHNQGPCHSCIG